MQIPPLACSGRTVIRINAASPADSIGGTYWRTVASPFGFPGVLRWHLPVRRKYCRRNRIWGVQAGSGHSGESTSIALRANCQDALKMTADYIAAEHVSNSPSTTSNSSGTPLRHLRSPLRLRDLRARLPGCRTAFACPCARQSSYLPSLCSIRGLLSAYRESCLLRLWQAEPKCPAA